MSRSHRSVVGLLITALASAGNAQTAVSPGSGSTNTCASRASGVPAASIWQARIGGDLRKRECCFQPVPGMEGVWSAPNRAHEFRCRVSCEGLEVFPRQARVDGTGGAWNVTLRTRSVGRSGAVCNLYSPSISVEGNRIELDHGLVKEWLENGEKGVEQGWLIAVRPDGEAPLWIELEISGLTPCIDDAGKWAVLTDTAGTARLLYRDLRVFDACGSELDACMQLSSRGICLRIEDTTATYPLIIDPCLGDPDWTAQSDQAYARLGMGVAGAGDVNADGFDDVIVGAPDFDDGQADEGRAFLYLGSASGPSLAPDWGAECDQGNASFGTSICGAGDVNGDGFADVIAGAWRFTNGQTEEGRAFVYLGSASGSSLAPDWTAESDLAQAYFGRSVSGAGDVNADGFDDVIVGASGRNRAFLYLGSAGGLSPTATWIAVSDHNDADFGISVAGAGDVNADGFDDVIVGAGGFDHGQADEGRAFLYLGSPSGPSLDPDWTAESDQGNAEFGFSVSAAGDVNGDGFDDVIVGARSFDYGHYNEGAAFVYLGSAHGPSLAPDWTAGSAQDYGLFGTSVSTAGDVNGDAFADVIVGAPEFDNGQNGEGRAFLYLGSVSGLSLAPIWTTESDQVNASFGRSVCRAGDVNADGFDDVIVGAIFFDDGQTDEGRAYVYLGHGRTGTGYCIATANSTGVPAGISAGCSASSATGELTLDAEPVPDQFGLFIHGMTQTQIPFGNGYLCVADDLVRGAVIHPWSHVASYLYDNSDAEHSLAAYVGTTRNFQYWFRDPVAGGAFFNTSNAVSVVILP